MRLVFKQFKTSTLKKHVIIGFAKDKDHASILSFFPKDISYYLCSSSNSRIMSQDELETCFKKYNLSYNLFPTSYEAYQCVLQNTGENDIILITGSTFIVSDLLKYLDKV